MSNNSFITIKLTPAELDLVSHALRTIVETNTREAEKLNAQGLPAIREVLISRDSLALLNEMMVQSNSRFNTGDAS